MAPPDASAPLWGSWTPGEDDLPQAEECTRAKATYNTLAVGLSDEEICARALREVEWQRVSVEIRRAAMAFMLGELPEVGRRVQPRLEPVVDRWLVNTTAVLNLMGIETLLPGDPAGPSVLSGSDTARIYLGDSADAQTLSDYAEQLDALGGLIREFHRSDIILNGLGITELAIGDEKRHALVAVHPAVMASFGDFLVRKYVMDGWRLG